MTDYGWRHTHVLECSQVRTPEEFWALYLARTKVEHATLLGRNLDALFDALTRGGPGVPTMPCFIEVRNHEALAAEHPVFVEKLAAIAAELKARKGAFELFLCESFAPPRGHLYESGHAAYLSHEARGMRVVSVLWEREAPRAFLLIQCPGEVWQRFFIDDTWPARWSELSTEDVYSSHEADELEDVSAILGPGEHVLDKVETGRSGPSSVEITLMSGALLRFAPAAPGDFETEFVLTLQSAPSAAEALR